MVALNSRKLLFISICLIKSNILEPCKSMEFTSKSTTTQTSKLKGKTLFNFFKAIELHNLLKYCLTITIFK